MAVMIGTGLSAQEYDSGAVISEFLGNIPAEETDPEEVARLEKFIAHPLKINMSTSSKLKESGLLTHYQIVCLLDYRSRHGDILSFGELSAVDGFGEDFVRKISPFISLESSLLPGQRQGRMKFFHEFEVKAGIRSANDGQEHYGLRYRLEAGERVQAGLAVSKSYDALIPEDFTGNIEWNFRWNSTKLVVGDFNARFGQGLALWNGMSISGLNRPSSYLKRSSGISSSGSFTGNYALRGLASETLCGRFRISALAAITSDKNVTGCMPAANISWLWPGGQMGITHFTSFAFSPERLSIPDMKTSFDLAFTAAGVDCFAETSYDWACSSAATLIGTVFPSGENSSMAAMLRCYPPSYNPIYSAAARALTKCSNEYGCSVSSEFAGGKWVNINGTDGFGASVRRYDAALCADAAYFPVTKSADVPLSVQAKCLIEIKYMISESMAFKLRLSERYRTWGDAFRTDIRIDLLYYSRYFDGIFRANALKCDDIGSLFYAEGTFKFKVFRFSLRSGVFFVDNWDDRIYVYERDVPGSYNVPAFYGRGYWVAFSGNFRFARWGRVYLRGAITQYPFMKQFKPGKAELKLMLKFQI